jgi:hypothetical protein
MERGGEGDLVQVLTGVGDGRRRSESGAATTACCSLIFAHGRCSGGTPAVGTSSLDAAPRRTLPGDDGVAQQCSVVAARVRGSSAMVTATEQRKGDRDSIGTTSKLARERQNRTRSMRQTRWCAHLRLVRNDGDGRARRSWRVVVSITRGADIGIEQSTTSRR